GQREARGLLLPARVRGHRRSPFDPHRRGILAAAAASAAALGVRVLGAGRPARAEGVASPPPPRAGDWDSVRAQFEIEPDLVDMSALLIAAHPYPVREAIERHRRGLDRDPVGYLTRNNGRLRRATLASAARYLGGRADE